MAIGNNSSTSTAPLLSAAASMSPDNNNNNNNHQLLSSDDPNYALHGEIMLLVLVLLFIVFLFCLVFFLYMKRPRGGGHPKQSLPEQFYPGNFPPHVVQQHKAQLDSTGSKLQQQQQHQYDAV
ncbi:hypothetical protein Dsin_007225 [Dipteronia sinensis]|uniref:Uncharacterized protein n=1 Tax=Dipteronia sinensis TaxID=43782 RepID=A0AAE0EGA4_9ROSI|nr:hypothetical protein Dsin_007225 [Dipteronia sinensis]